MSTSILSKKPRLLKEDSISLKNPTNTPQTEAPPTSPKSNFVFDFTYETVIPQFPNLQNLQIPYVRAIGIKACIERLAEFFECKEYKYNLLQFWFLDLITDCLWRAQDEYQLTDEYQKVVLEWILYIFDIIRDPMLNFSRKELFKVFKEAMTVAEEHIEAGCSILPPPGDLFSLRQDEDSVHSYHGVFSDSDDSESSGTSLSLSWEDCSDNESFVAFKNTPDVYTLPKMDCRCDISISSSIDTLSEKSLCDATIVESAPPNSEVELANGVHDNIQDYYKYDPDEVHSRFLAELPPEKEPSFASDLDLDLSSDDEAVDFYWVDEVVENEAIYKLPPQNQTEHEPKQNQSHISNEDRRLSTFRRRSKVSSTGVSEQSISIMSAEERKAKEEELRKAWIEYNVYEQKIKEMDSTGYKPFEEDDTSTYNPWDSYKEDDPYIAVKTEWQKYLTTHQTHIWKLEENKFVNSCLLLFIKQFVFDYFYENFQYKIIQLAFKAPQNLITERINSEWCIPKIIRDDFKRPAAKKPKKEKKAPKEKKSKKTSEKKSKKDKSSKGSKKSKKDSAKDKKSKKGGKKSDKGSKASDKDKKKKKELDNKLKEQQQRLLEEKMLAEANRRLLFPLSEAADDTFFHMIFNNWQKPEKTAKGKDAKGAKGAKGKKKK